MAYNMYNQPSGWMPQQQNPGYSYGGMPMQQSYNNAPSMPIPQKPVFVDGEMAAKVFQMPENWPVGVPLYLWDVNGECFYMKVIAPNGVPMPLRTFDYKEREPAPAGYLTGNGPDMSQYVTKNDLDQRFNELKQMMQSNQNGVNNQQQNRGAAR